MDKFNEFFDKINECIIASVPIGSDRFVLFKNRDRGYYPENKIVHEIVEETEIAYIQDIDSGWKEGLNEHGISIINSRFSASKEHKREPIEQFKLIPYSEKKLKSIKSEKEAIIVDILSQCDTVDKAVEMAIKKKLMGVTIISNGLESVEIENTDDFGHQTRKWSIGNMVELPNSLIVRTNHGILIPEAGYQEYPGSTERHSSEIRKLEAERILQTPISDPIQMFDLLGQQPYDKKSEMNVFRTTQLHFTGGQLSIDPKNLVMNFAHCGETKFEGVKGEVENPKIRIYIYDKSAPDTKLWDSSKGASAQIAQ